MSADSIELTHRMVSVATRVFLDKGYGSIDIRKQPGTHTVPSVVGVKVKASSRLKY
jgi:hypothetical protein